MTSWRHGRRDFSTIDDWARLVVQWAKVRGVRGVEWGVSLVVVRSQSGAMEKAEIRVAYCALSVEELALKS